MLLDTLETSFRGHFLAGKGINRVGKGVIRAGAATKRQGRGIARAAHGNKMDF